MKHFFRRIAKLEETRPPASLLPIPRIVNFYVAAAAPCLNEGPIKYGIVTGTEGCFERAGDESEEGFFARLEKNLPPKEPRGGFTITVFSEARVPGFRVG
jgi:hypothetical protein